MVVLNIEKGLLDACARLLPCVARTWETAYEATTERSRAMILPKDAMIKFRTISYKKGYISKYCNSTATKALHSKTMLSCVLWVGCLSIQCRGLAWKLYTLQVQPREFHGHQRSGLWPCGKSGPCRDPGMGQSLNGRDLVYTCGICTSKVFKVIHAKPQPEPDHVSFGEGIRYLANEEAKKYSTQFTFSPE